MDKRDILGQAAALAQSKSRTPFVGQRIQAETVLFSFSHSNPLICFGENYSQCHRLSYPGRWTDGPERATPASRRRRRHGGARLTLVSLPLWRRPPPRCLRLPLLIRRRFHLVLRRRDPVLLRERYARLLPVPVQFQKAN